MAAVPLPAAELAWRMARAGIEGVEIAAINGAKLTVVSGEPDGVRALRAALAADAVVCRQLAAGHAFHSRMLEPVRDELTAWVAQHVTARPPRIPYVSTMTGALVTADEVANPGYWAAHMCTPVRFDTALATMLAQDDLALLELGPGQFLGDMARARPDCPPERWQLIVATLPAAGDPRRADTVLADAAGRLWLAGVPLDWDGYQQGRPAGKVWLPGYPFQRERHWIDEPAPQRA
jgi:acyl transferase domain-containing protein